MDRIATPTLINVQLSPSLAYAPNYIYIGLGSMWGNPYVNKMSRARAVRSYAKLLDERLASSSGDFWKMSLYSLKNKTLGCHCHPQPCHGNVIINKFIDLFIST